MKLNFKNLRVFFQDVFLICFSVVSPTSLKNAETKWLDEVRHHSQTKPILLVGTMADLRDNQEKIKFLQDQGFSGPITKDQVSGHYIVNSHRLYLVTPCTFFVFRPMMWQRKWKLPNIWNVLPRPEMVSPMSLLKLSKQLYRHHPLPPKRKAAWFFDVILAQTWTTSVRSAIITSHWTTWSWSLTWKLISGTNKGVFAIIFWISRVAYFATSKMSRGA